MEYLWNNLYPHEIRWPPRKKVHSNGVHVSPNRAYLGSRDEELIATDRAEANDHRRVIMWCCNGQQSTLNWNQWRTHSIKPLRCLERSHSNKNNVVDYFQSLISNHGRIKRPGSYILPELLRFKTKIKVLHLIRKHDLNGHLITFKTTY